MVFVPSRADKQAFIRSGSMIKLFVSYTTGKFPPSTTILAPVI
jgi:hypothetical protein